MKIKMILAAGALALATSAGSAQSADVGSFISGTTFRLATGESHSMADMRGQVVVLNYWMSDCRACDAQLDILDRYYRQRHQVGLRVLVMPVEELTTGQLNRAFKGKLVHPLSSINGSLEMKGLPTTYVIDRYGQVRHVSSGVMTTGQLNEILVPLLRQPQP